MSHKMRYVVDLMNIRGFWCVFVMLCFAQGVYSAENAVIYGPATPAASHVGVQSYSQWKADKLQVLGIKIQDIQQKRRLEASAQKTKEAQGLKDAEAREIENLHMAKKLKISDYLITYIFSFPQRKAALKEAASLMTPTEVAEIMEAYAQSLSKKDSGSAPLTADLIGTDSGQ